jgi:hypothetical protein
VVLALVWALLKGCFRSTLRAMGMRVRVSLMHLCFTLVDRLGGLLLPIQPVTGGSYRDIENRDFVSIRQGAHDALRATTHASLIRRSDNILMDARIEHSLGRSIRKCLRSRHQIH